VAIVGELPNASLAFAGEASSENTALKDIERR
jgi:hypothetical protein